MYPSSQSPAPGPKNVIAIAAGKGGVGKSTVTVNLARALQAAGRAVGILDADIYGPSLRRMLPEDRLPAQADQHLLPADCAGIRLISMAFFRKDHEAAAVRAPIANSLIQQFLTQIQWGPLDDLLIDFPPGTGDIQLTLCQKAQLSGAIMVTTPQEVALMDVRKAMHLFAQVKVPILGIVENMSYFLDAASGQMHALFGRGGGERLASEMGVRFLGQIPVAPAISQSGDEGTSLLTMKSPDAQMASKAFAALAQQIMHEISTLKESGEIANVDFQGQSLLTVGWTDGSVSRVSFSTLQRHCPCAQCIDETTGQRRSQPAAVAADLTAQSVFPVGRYALKVQFSSGCSTGIYPFSLIRHLSAKDNI
jgi:ATP-binding protein involved in chromosome partitioning